MTQNRRFRPSRGPVTILAVAALIVLAPSGCAVEITGSWGFNGFHRPGRWTPVVIVIENFPSATASNAKKGQGVIGRLMVSSSTYDGKQVSVERPVDVPWQTRKRYTLYIKAIGQNPTVEVRLYNRGRMTYHEIRPNPVKEPEAMIAVLSQDPTAISVAEPMGPVMGYGREARPRHVRPEMAPDRWYGYDGADVVALPAYGAHMLDPQRLEALAKWVRAGGKLLVLTGRNGPSFRGSPIERWLPARIGDLKEVEASVLDLPGSRNPTASARNADQKVVITDLIPTGEGTALWQRDGNLLAARRTMGLGSVELWAMDLSGASAVVRSRTGVRALWAALFGPTPIADRNRDFFETFTSGFDFGMDVKKPNLLLVGFGLMAYFFVVGPLNFYLLTRFGKLEWGWVTVPAIVAVFSIALYTTAYLTKGGDMVSRSFTVIHARAGQTQARAACIGGLFSQRSGSYPVHFANSREGSDPARSLLSLAAWHDPDFPGGGLMRPGAGDTQFLPVAYRQPAPQGSLIGGEAVSPVEQSEPTMRYGALSMNQWSLRYFTGDALVDLSGPIEARLTRGVQLIEGSVTNNSDLYLENASLIVGNSVLPLGDLPPGASPNVRLDLERPSSGDIAGVGDTWDPSKGNRYEGIGRGKAEKLEREVRGMFDRAVLNRWEVGAVPRRGEVPLLVAWPRQNPVTLEVGGRPNQRSSHTMLVCELRTVIAEAGALVPNEKSLHAIQPILEAESTEGVEFFREAGYFSSQKDIQGPGLYLKADSYATFALIPPIAPEDGRARVAQLRVKYHDPGNKSQTLSIRALNFVTGRFDLLPPASPDKIGGKEWIPLPLDGAAHINPFDNRVVVQFRPENNPQSRTVTFNDNCAVVGLDVNYNFSPP